jgi:tRNA G18 (ribose-2'-O)-methylase SpoU
MFRTADGAGVRHMHLAGITPTPEHPQMKKTSLGAESTVAWTDYPDPVQVAADLARRGHRLWALEGGDEASSLFELARTLRPSDTTAIVLVLGHEVSGVDPRVARHCERVVRIPMAGAKGSLNVGVAFGVACYVLRHGWRLAPVLT